MRPNQLMKSILNRNSVGRARRGMLDSEKSSEYSERLTLLLPGIINSSSPSL